MGNLTHLADALASALRRAQRHVDADPRGGGYASAHGTMVGAVEVALGELRRAMRDVEHLETFRRQVLASLPAIIESMRAGELASVTVAEALLADARAVPVSAEPFCACGRPVSRCDGSRAGCRERAAGGAS